MHINFAFDGIAHSNALKEHTYDKFKFIEKFGVLDFSVVFTRDKRDAIASIKFRDKYAHQRAEDYYKAIDLLSDKVFNILSDQKEEQKIA